MGSFFFIIGRQLNMGHAVDKDLLLLVQDEVRSLIKDYRAIDSQLIYRTGRFVKLMKMQARIQDFEKIKWGVNFCNNVIEPKPS